MRLRETSTYCNPQPVCAAMCPEPGKLRSLSVELPEIWGNQVVLLAANRLIWVVLRKRACYNGYGNSVGRACELSAVRLKQPPI